MENNKEIGKLFKEKLNSLEAIPKDGGWNDIQTELDKKKKKKFFLFPFWIGAICLLSIFVIIQYSKFGISKTTTLDFINLKQTEILKKKIQEEKNIIIKTITLGTFKKLDSSSIATKSDLNTLNRLNSIRTKKPTENDFINKKL